MVKKLKPTKATQATAQRALRRRAAERAAERAVPERSQLPPGPLPGNGTGTPSGVRLEEVMNGGGPAGGQVRGGAPAAPGSRARPVPA